MIRRLLQWLWARLGRAPSTVFPERRVYFEVSAPAIGDKFFVDEVYRAFHEASSEFARIRKIGLRSRLEDKVGTYVASNGVVIRWTASRMETRT